MRVIRLRGSGETKLGQPSQVFGTRVISLSGGNYTTGLSTSLKLWSLGVHSFNSVVYSGLWTTLLQQSFLPIFPMFLMTVSVLCNSATIAILSHVCFFYFGFFQIYKGYTCIEYLVSAATATANQEEKEKKRKKENTTSS